MPRRYSGAREKRLPRRCYGILIEKQKSPLLMPPVAPPAAVAVRYASRGDCSAVDRTAAHRLMDLLPSSARELPYGFSCMFVNAAAYSAGTIARRQINRRTRRLHAVEVHVL